MTTTTKELLALVDSLQESITDWGDNMRNEAMADLLDHAHRIRAALPALCAEVEALQAVAEAARRSLSQTAANQRDGLVPTVYYRAHQDLANALSAIDAAKEPK